MSKEKKVTIKIENVKSKIFGFLSDDVLNQISDKLSFKKKNIEYSPKFIEGKWDGYTRLFNKYYKTFQTGLLSLVYTVLKENNYKIKLDDQRAEPYKNRNWNLILPKNMSLYDFQKEAIDIAKKYSRGTFSIATGAGKTLTFTAIIGELSIAPVIIYVPTLLLLYQIKEEIERFLVDKNGKPVEVGVVGNGECNIKDITVMTILTAITAFDMEYNRNKEKITYLTPEQIQNKNQKLLKKKKINKEDPDLSEDLSFVVTRKEILQDLIKNTKVIITDESHRCSSVIYQEVLKQSPLAYYRFALSGTNFREDNTEMLIQAIFGKELLKVSCSELIRRPDVKIVKPYIFMMNVPDNDNADYSSYAKVRQNCIVMSENRNQIISNVASYMQQFGPTLLLVEIIDHGKILENMIPGSLFVSGKTSKKIKQQALEDLMSGELKILIASRIIDEGINLPGLKVLILCDSGKAATKLYQRIGRVVREVPGKEYGLVVDFRDKNTILSSHADIRENLYLTEDEWVLTKVSSNKIESFQKFS